jgi:hypothetical protein
VADEPKFANVNPSSVGNNPESAGVATTSVEPLDPPLQLARVATNTRPVTIRRVRLNVEFMNFFPIG